MKSFAVPFIVIIVLSMLPITAHATLIDNGDGTVTQIRIDGSQLMWLKDANTSLTSGYCSTPGNCYDTTSGRMAWDQANTWIASLNSANYLGHNDWRLPQTLPVNGSAYVYDGNFYDGSTDVGYNISAPGSAYPGSTESEMAYMFYYELGNLGYYDTSGSAPQPGWGLTNTGLFTNLQLNTYWSDTEYAPNPGFALDFNFYNGTQNSSGKDLASYAWAVRSVAVPEPASLLLLGTGLLGVMGLKRKWNK